MFIALEVAIEIVRALRPVLARLRTRSVELHDQLEQAIMSTPLNLAEGSKRTGKDRQHHYRIAAGSCHEARTAIALAEALGYLDGLDLGEALALFHREGGLLHGLTHPRRA